MTDTGLVLPDEIALFPLRDAALFPRSHLPLNMFEPRYLAMTEYALGANRLIGMIRPRSENEDMNPPLYSIGCAGRVVSFSETDNGQFVVELLGVSRFRLISDHLTDGNFRMGEVDWSAFRSDPSSPQEDTDSLRPQLLSSLETYLKSTGLAADWETIDNAATETIVNSVAVSCPFDADEKQALLEAPSLTQRIRDLMTLMEIAAAEALDDMAPDTFSRIQ